MPLIAFLGHGAALVILCSGLLYGAHRYFGLPGLAIYTTLALIISNIQISLASVCGQGGPTLALGTEVFCTIPLAQDIINQFYGTKAATSIVILSTLSMASFSLIMQITCGYTPAPGFEGAHQALSLLFSPFPSLILSSLIAYMASQLLDVMIFSTMRQRYNNTYLWWRTLVSTSLSTLADTVIFNTLAWIIFFPKPFEIVLKVYMAGSLLERLFWIGPISFMLPYINRRLTAHTP